jgi:tetratricopeptide (TPR) repeat protein
MCLPVPIRIGLAGALSLALFFTLGIPATMSAQSGAAHPASNSSRSELQDSYDAAQRFQQAGKTTEAEQQYRLFLADALAETAIAYTRAGSYSKAAPLFDESLGLKPDSPGTRIEYANAALMLGDFSHAQTLAQKYFADFPQDKSGDAEAHQIAGRAFLKLERDDEARKEFEAAVALDPTFQNGYDLAVACLDLNDLKCATSIFQEMETSFGDHAAIHFSFGIAYGQSDYQDQAIIEFRKAIAEDPHIRGAHYSLAAALLAGKNAEPEAAEIELKKETALFPDNFLAWAALGKLATSRHDNAAAERFLKKAIALNSHNPDAFLYQGQLYFNTERYSEAEGLLRDSIRLTTDVSRNRYQVQKAHYLLGRILARQGKDAEADAEMKISRTFLQTQLSQDKDRLSSMLDPTESSEPGDSGAKPGPAHVEDEDSPLRQVELNQATAREKQLAPAIADSFNNLGVISSLSGNYPAALRYFEQAAEWNPTLEGLDYNWGRAAFSASRFGEAVGPLSRHLRQHSDDQGVRTALAISEFMTGAYAACVKTVRQDEAKQTTMPQVEYVYAESLIKTGDIAAGVQRLLALESAHPEVPDTHRALGEVYAGRAEGAKALDEFVTATRLNPNDSETHYDLGKLQLDSGDPAKAIPELESAVRLSPDDPRFHLELAAAYKAALRGDDAAKELQIYAALRSKEMPSATPSTNAARP